MTQQRTISVGVTERGVAALRVDWPNCQARGLCAEVLPELIGLDEWGYPVIRGDVPAGLLELAKEAAAVCPRQALKLRPNAPR